ncbi:MAG: hypothetical protein J6U10_08545 [Lachnospiraceae bacterium]|nr:hypothetical protein [Lachnospiraceae bacterium]MBP5184276.1 hypothetical protein [Lachnospiraceae bacterium]
MKERSFFRTLIKIALILVLAIVLITVLRVNCEIKGITVKGSTIYTDQEIWDKTSDGPLDIYAPFYVMSVNRHKHPAIPFIEQVDAKLTGLNTVELTVYEKKILGCIYAMGGYFFFDRDGLVTEFQQEKPDDFILVEGAKFDALVLGKNLKVAGHREYFDVVMNIVMALEETGQKAELLEFLDDGAAVLTLGETTVRLGKHEDHTVAVRALPEIINALENKSYILYMENYSENNRTVVGKPK